MTQEDKKLLLKDLCGRFAYHPFVYGKNGYVYCIKPNHMTDKDIIEEKLHKLTAECAWCAAPGDNPCRGCEINTNKNELLKELKKYDTRRH